MEEKLKQQGACLKVGHIGCGHGISTIVMAKPFANDQLEDNLNPVGRLFYAASTMVCIPASLSQNGPALGAQTGEPGISKVVKAGGFKHFRRATQTPFNIVYEAKP